MKQNRPSILSIAGYDPVAGAGLLSDIKAIEAHGGYGMGVVTAVTYQNEENFFGFDWLSVDQVIRQLEALLDKHCFDAIKIGMIQYPAMFVEVMGWLMARVPEIPIVWDPVCGASAGCDFQHDFQGQSATAYAPFSGALSLVTPNLDEAMTVFGSRDVEVLHQQVQSGAIPPVLLKGGHADTQVITDYLILEENVFAFEGEKFNLPEKHGTGCVLSATIATLLGQGVTTKEACAKAKTYIHAFITSNNSKLGYHIYQKSHA